MKEIHWQLLYEIWEKNKKNLLGVSLKYALDKKNLDALEQFEKTLIEQYKINPKFVSEQIGVDLAKHVNK